MIEGKLEDWEKNRKLFLRIHVASAKTEIDGKPVSFEFTQNAAGNLFFVEFPNNIVVTYSAEDIVRDAVDLYEKHLKNQSEAKPA